MGWSMARSDFKSSDSIVIDSYGPSIRLTMSRYSLFGRQTSDSKPPRMHQVKTAVTIARHVCRRAPTLTSEALFFGSALAGEANAISLMMPEMTRVRTKPMSLFVAIDGLMSLRDSCVISIVGESRAPRDELVVALANVIDGLDVDTRKIVLEAVLDNLSKKRESLRASADSEIVIQEKPGKFSTVHLPDEVAIKHAERRVQSELTNIQTQRDYVAKISAEDGWSAGGVVIEAVADNNPKSFSVSAAKFRWRDLQLSLDMPPLMAAAIIGWFKAASGIEASQILQVSVSAQSVALAGRLAIEICAAAGTAKMPQIIFPDFGLGWMPVASLFSGLADSKPPALFVFCNNFPDVEVVAVWR